MSAATEEGSDPAFSYDPAFKLFGRTIPVLPFSDCKTKSEDNKHSEESGLVEEAPISAEKHLVFDYDVGEDAPESEDESIGSSVPEELGSSLGSNDGGDEEKPSDGLVPDASLVAAQVNDGGTQTGEGDRQGDESHDDAPRKPDKLIPCPRCNSLDTKFCYYNNYNVNQPRHFCKNCQRYWTAGGTLRNVPVGAGRRKNKHSASHHRHMLPDCIAVRGDSPDSAQQLLSCSGSSPAGLNRHAKTGPSPSKPHLLPLDVCSLGGLDSSPSSTVLNFGQESPLCESTGATSYNPHRAEVLQSYSSEQGRLNGRACAPLRVEACLSKLADTDTNLKPIHGQSTLCNSRDVAPKADAPAGDFASRSSLPAQPPLPLSVEPKVDPSSSADVPATADASLGWAAGAPFTFVANPWQYGGWNSPATATAAALSLTCNAAASNHPQPMAPVNHPPWGGTLGGLWPGLPWPLIQSPIWGPPAWGGTWTMPWASAAAAAAAIAPANPVVGSPILGKHPREQGQSEGEHGGSLWVPKTLRIGDPGEAARSSIWTALGLENGPDSMTSGGIFRALQTKMESKEADGPHFQALRSNPAAMTRSNNFQESNSASQSVDVQVSSEKLNSQMRVEEFGAAKLRNQREEYVRTSGISELFSALVLVLKM